MEKVLLLFVLLWQVGGCHWLQFLFVIVGLLLLPVNETRALRAAWRGNWSCTAFCRHLKILIGVEFSVRLGVLDLFWGRSQEVQEEPSASTMAYFGLLRGAVAKRRGCFKKKKTTIWNHPNMLKLICYEYRIHWYREGAGRNKQTTTKAIVS